MCRVTSLMSSINFSTYSAAEELGRPPEERMCSSLANKLTIRPSGVDASSWIGKMVAQSKRMDKRGQQ